MKVARDNTPVPVKPADTGISVTSLLKLLLNNQAKQRLCLTETLFPRKDTLKTIPARPIGHFEYKDSTQFNGNEFLLCTKRLVTYMYKPELK